MKEWRSCKHILIIRPDNLGDLLMSSPAIRAVKNTIGCKITLLTSQSAAAAAMLLPEIDEIIAVDLPWVKKDSSSSPNELMRLAKELEHKHFDACILFTVYSQNPLAAALLMWMAKIPLRLAYCRENPYDLLNYWLPDKEPYSFCSRHQAERDLYLVKFIGVETNDDKIRLHLLPKHIRSAEQKLSREGIRPDQPFLIFHAGVSEEKRKFPEEKWVCLAQRAIRIYGLPVLFTGTATERALTDRLQEKTGKGSYSFGGKTTIPEFAALISKARLLVSVNTAAIHIAAGLQIPVIALYAQTNPQHKPWKVKNKVFEYSVPAYLESDNEVIRYVNKLVYAKTKPIPETESIIAAMDHFMLSAVQEPYFVP